MMKNDELEMRQVLIIEDKTAHACPVMEKAIGRLIQALLERNIMVIRSMSPQEAFPIIESNMDIDAFLVCVDDSEECGGLAALEHIRERQSMIPVFLLGDRAATTRRISSSLMELANEFVWIYEDSPVFIAGRIQAAIERSRAELLPPLMKAIWSYNEKSHEYSWAAPGHQGGVGFTKSPVGKKFYDFYGENLFRTDTGIERGSIGSLLDHEGAFHESEVYAAKVFGADESYSVVVGTSGSNRTIMQACLSEGDLALCDRNCHKSIEQGLINTGAVPVYMLPTRNCYGIIGPIPPSRMSREAIRKGIDSVTVPHNGRKPTYAVVTNCTYDGICYNARRAEELLEQSVDRIHFDEAWYAYARFNPVYEDHYAMHGDPAQHKGPTVFATHSTHKLLNALSQASYIHVRHGRKSIDFDRFNQAYMMHSTTSPLYAICASNDISSAMMKNNGISLTREVIAEAVDFRQACARLQREAEKSGRWFFKPWNPEKVRCPRQNKEYDFADAPRDLLIGEQSCWKIRKGEKWHGFNDLEDDDWIMLDPIKVSILAPGMNSNGIIAEQGVPAALVSYYLYQEGIVPTRTTDFQIMFLFSMGITKGKWGTLLNTLLNFRRAYEKNTPVSEVLPGLAALSPKRYGNCGLHDLADNMFAYLKENTPDEQLNRAFERLPEMVLTPRQAYARIVSGDVEFVPSDSLANRVSATSVIPYPPGIPMMMSGENFGAADSPMIRYLHALEKWDKEFPGFEHVTEGAKSIDGKYCVMCVK